MSTADQQRDGVPGFACRLCGVRIVAAFEEMICGFVRCGDCGATGTLDREKSPEVVAALEELRDRLRDSPTIFEKIGRKCSLSVSC